MLQNDNDIIASVSDFHLSVGGRLEDFVRDDEFVSFIEYLRASNPEAHLIRLQLVGDIFDPLMVPIDGKFDPPPYEDICLKQLELIIAAHPKFFDALAAFHEDPRTELVFFIGNHDFFIEWDSLQTTLMNRICKGHSHRIRFTYQELHRGVYYAHGNFEPQNTIEMTDRYILPEEFTKTRRALLNYPYGSYLTAQTKPMLRELHQYVGRLACHGYLYKEAATRHWMLGLHALWLYVENFVSNRFFAFWDVRRKTNLWITLRIVYWVSAGGKQEDAVQEIFDKYPNVKTVVCGHDHIAKDVLLKGGRFLNTGTWALQYDVVWHDEPNPPWGLKLLTQATIWASHVFHRPEYVRNERLPVVLAKYSEDSEEIDLFNWNHVEKKLEKIT
ncbi:MAG: hypothetical protein WCJ29_04920 [bacterium]